MERNAYCNTAMNAAEAHERCVDLGVAISKIENNLYQATEWLRHIEGYIEAAIKHSEMDRSNVPKIIMIDWPF